MTSTMPASPWPAATAPASSDQRNSGTSLPTPWRRLVSITWSIAAAWIEFLARCAALEDLAFGRETGRGEHAANAERSCGWLFAQRS